MSLPNPASCIIPANMRVAIGGIADGDITFGVLITDDQDVPLARFAGRGRGMVLKPEGIDAFIREPSSETLHVRFRLFHSSGAGGADQPATLVSAADLSLGNGEYLRTFIAEDTIDGQKQSLIFYLVALNATTA